MSTKANEKPYQDLTTREAVEAIMSPEGGAAVIDFWAAWCGPCRAMAPHFETVAAKYGDEPVRFYKLNTEERPELSGAFNVRSLPTIMFILNGQIEDVQIGMMNAHALDQRVERLVSKAKGEGFFQRLFGRKK